jgi:hypothetical protein
VQQSRSPSEVQWIVPGFTAGAVVARCLGRAGAARDLVAELEALPAARADTNQYLLYLPENVRIALAAGDLDLARRLISGVEPKLPIQHNELLMTRAAIAEAEGRTDEAARGYAEAATFWERVGNVPELVFALLGAGRSLDELNRGDEARPYLEKAREIVAGLGAVGMLGQAEAQPNEEADAKEEARPVSRRRASGSRRRSSPG